MTLQNDPEYNKGWNESQNRWHVSNNLESTRIGKGWKQKTKQVSIEKNHHIFHFSLTKSSLNSIPLIMAPKSMIPFILPSSLP